MNCTRCNCEMPEQAKFCPVCGFKNEPNSEAQKCPVCGLLLEPGAKRCAVCGSLAAGAAAEEQPSEPEQPIIETMPVIGELPVQEDLFDTSTEDISTDFEEEYIPPVITSFDEIAQSFDEQTVSVPVAEPIFAAPPAAEPKPSDLIFGSTAQSGSVFPQPSETAPPAAEPKPSDLIFGSTAQSGSVFPQQSEASPPAAEPKPSDLIFGSTAQSGSVFPQPSEAAPPAAEPKPSDLIFGSTAQSGSVFPQQSEAAPPATEPKPSDLIFGSTAQSGSVFPQPSEAAPPAAEPKPSDLIFGSTAQSGSVFPQHSAAAQQYVPPVYNTTKATAKKTNKLPIIVGVCAAAVVVICGATFALNPSGVQSLFMGSKNYAQMLEKKQVEAVVRTVEQPEVAASLDSALSGAAATCGVSAAYMGPSQRPAADLQSVVNAAFSSVSGTAGEGGVITTVSADVSMTDSAKTILAGESHTELDRMLRDVNEFDADFYIVPDSDKMLLGGVYGDVNAEMLLCENGTVFLSLPNYSSDSLMATLDKPKGSDRQASEFDAEKLNAVIGALGECYLKYYKNANITVKSGEIEAMDVVGKGKLVTARIEDDDLQDMLTEMSGILAETGELTEFIAALCRSSGTGITAKDIKDGMEKALNSAKRYISAVEIKTVVNSRNAVVAKSVRLMGGDERTFVMAKDKTHTAYQILAEDKAIVSIYDEKTSSDSGSVRITLDNSDSECKARVDYYNVGKKKFCGSEVLVGSFELSVIPPEDFTENSGLSTEVAAAVTDAKLCITIDADANNYTGSFSLNLPQYLNAGVAFTTRPFERSALNYPENTIDITAAINGEALSAETEKKLTRFVSEVATKLEKSPTLLSGLSEGLNSFADPDISAEKFAEISERISNDIGRLVSLDGKYSFTPAQEERFADLLDALKEYDIELSRGLRKTEADDLIERLSATEEAIDKLEKDLKKSAASSGTGYNPAALPDYDYNSLSFDELSSAAFDLEIRYAEIVLYHYDEISDSEELTALYNSCEKDYKDFSKSFEKLVDDVYDGNLSVPRLREARKGAKKFAESLQALIDAIGDETA